VGVAAAQLLQSLFTLCAGWVILSRALPATGPFPRRWSRKAFKAILPYSAAFQLNNLFTLSVDPLVKLLVTRFAGLAAVTYFEMANQMVQRVRQVLIAAGQTITPAVAYHHAINAVSVPDIHNRAYKNIFAISIPYFMLIGSLVPALASAWIGHREPTFILMCWILLFGFTVNTICSPSFFTWHWMISLRTHWRLRFAFWSSWLSTAQSPATACGDIVLPGSCGQGLQARGREKATERTAAGAGNSGTRGR
jgi:O-antigen/teichoic acid export membrane protein